MAGMLSGLFSPQMRDLRQDEQDEERRMQTLATMDPFQAAAYASYGGARMAGQGLASAAVSAMGGDPRSPLKRQSDAVEAAKRQVAALGFSPDDPKSIDQFYRQVISILQQKGLAAEAMEVAQEYSKQQRQARTDDLKLRDLQRKENADAAKAKAAEDRNAIARERLGKTGPEALQLLDQLDNLDPLNPNDEYRRKALIARLNQLGGQNGVKFEQLGDRVIVTDMQGNPLRTDQVGAVPMNEKDKAKADEKESKNTNAYRNAKAGMQQQYDAAVDLYNMPGFDSIFGKGGQYIGKDGLIGTAATFFAAGTPAGDAFEKWKQVTGATFLAGLTQLRQAAAATGGTGTGLGAVSNTEGDKVQAAGAALGRVQSAASARTQLRVYIQTLVTASENIDAAAKAEGITPVPLVQKPLTGPQRGRTTTAAPQAPATPPAAPAAPAAVPAAPAAPSGGTVEFARDANGKIVRKQ